MVHLLAVRPSTRTGKKLMAVFDDGSIVHFGGAGCRDFTVYWKEYGRVFAYKKRAAYIQRHRTTESWLDPKAPGTLSRIILWEFPTVMQATRHYNRLVQKWQKTPSLRYLSPVTISKNKIS